MSNLQSLIRGHSQETLQAASRWIKAANVGTRNLIYFSVGHAGVVSGINLSVKSKKYKKSFFLKLLSGYFFDLLIKKTKALFTRQ